MNNNNNNHNSVVSAIIMFAAALTAHTPLVILCESAQRKRMAGHISYKLSVLVTSVSMLSVVLME